MRVLRTTLRLPCVTAACCATTSATAQADERAVRPLSASGPLGDERLPDEQRISRYGGAVALAAVRTLPTATAPRITRLRHLTEDDSLEVYPVLESHVDAGGQTWLHIRLPMRPTGQSGSVHENDLAPLKAVRTPLKAVRTMLRVNRSTLRATLHRNASQIWSSRIAIAAYSTLTDRPAGGVIGIHGTNQPQLIPGRPSHGCIRVPNAAITRLWRLMPIGTPVEIL